MSEENMNQETLISLLKEKTKELKTIQKKLQKVEEKYVDLHKNQKNL
jgi:hypothetical protein